MKIKFKIKASELEEYNNLFTNLVQINFDYIDYCQFYNIQCFLKTIADRIYKQAYEHKPEITLSISINEYHTLRHLIKISRNFISQSPFYCALSVSFCSNGDPQIDRIRHDQIILFDTKINHSIKLLR